MSGEIISNRILVIDDNEQIHNDIKKLLTVQSVQSVQDFLLQKYKQALFNEKEGDVEGSISYEIDSAFQGEEGAALVEKAFKENRPYFLAFVDIRMPPGWNGIQTIQKIWEVDPDIQTVINTAYSDYAWQELVEKLGKSDRLLILKKPFDVIEVRQIVCAMDQKWHLQQTLKQRFENLEELVEERTAKIRATLEATTDGIFVLGKEMMLLDYNQKFIDIWEGVKWTDLSLQAIVDLKDCQKLLEFLSHSADKVDGCDFNQLFTVTQEPISPLIREVKLKNEKTIEFFKQPLLLREEPVGSVISVRDVTERKKFEKQLTFRTTHDPLTGLPNRILLLEHLNFALNQAERNKKKIALLFIDLDGFKIINDSLGPSIGDRLLTEVAQRFDQAVRSADALYRVGGDEFVLVVLDVETKEGVIAVIKKMQQLLEVPFIVDEKHHLSLKCSMGISLFPEDGKSVDDLLKHSDAAMYRSKTIGKNSFQFYQEEMNAEIQERLELEQNLFLAYSLGELQLHYEPQMHLQSGAIIGFEALLRWTHSKMGAVSPSKIILIAEDMDFIVPLTEWIVHKACFENLRRYQSGLPFVTVAVNLSGAQAKSAEGMKVFERVLDELNYPPEKLEIEITEQVLIETSEEVKEHFLRLHNKGVIITIDDFGIGYSNFSYLARFPISKLKIDKTFIDFLPDNQIHVKIVKSIISLAHSLGIKVVAEGVEQKKQLEFLRELGCDIIQGYTICKPLDSNAFLQLKI